MKIKDWKEEKVFPKHTQEKQEKGVISWYPGERWCPPKRGGTHGTFCEGCICLRKGEEATVLEESGSEVSNARSTFKVWSHSPVEEGGQEGDSRASPFAFDGNCGILWDQLTQLCDFLLPSIHCSHTH